jgi:hypothetical protein
MATRVAALLALALAAVTTGSLAAAGEPRPTCPGTWINPACGLTERAVCVCERPPGHSVASCRWSCQPRP